MYRSQVLGRFATAVLVAALVCAAATTGAAADPLIRYRERACFDHYDRGRRDVYDDHELRDDHDVHDDGSPAEP